MYKIITKKLAQVIIIVTISLIFIGLNTSYGISGFQPEFEKIELSKETIRPGEELTVTYYWRNNGDEVPKDNSRVCIHFIDPTEKDVYKQIIINADYEPMVPTSQWEPDKLIKDGPHKIYIPSNITPGILMIRTRLFNPSVPLLNNELERGGYYIIGQIEIKEWAELLIDDFEGKNCEQWKVGLGVKIFLTDKVSKNGSYGLQVNFDASKPWTSISRPIVMGEKDGISFWVYGSGHGWIKVQLEEKNGLWTKTIPLDFREWRHIEIPRTALEYTKIEGDGSWEKIERITFVFGSPQVIPYAFFLDDLKFLDWSQDKL